MGRTYREDGALKEVTAERFYLEDSGEIEIPIYVYEKFIFGSREFFVGLEPNGVAKYKCSKSQLMEDLEGETKDCEKRLQEMKNIIERLKSSEAEYLRRDEVSYIKASWDGGGRRKSGY